MAIFGANARLELGGSFLASTAEGLKFANGFEFSATSPQTPPLLTISAPIGLQYGSRSGEVRSQGAILRVQNGQTLNLTGGNVAIDGGQLLAPGGRVELAGVAAAGEVGLTQQGQEWRLSAPDGLARADVAIGKNAIVDVRSDGGGSIAITARNFTGTGGETQGSAGIGSDLGAVDAQAGDIDINATEAINLDGMVISNRVPVSSTGNAGNINITTGTLSFTNGGRVSASTLGRGNAGNISITARGRVSFNGGSNLFSSGAFNGVALGAIGNGGNVSITTGRLSLTNGGQVAAGTFGQGNAGNVSIMARDAVSFDGVGSNGSNSSALIGALSNSDPFTSVVILGLITLRKLGLNSGASSTVGSGVSGQGGTIAINTDRFSITNGAQLSASSEGRGAAGDLEVAARQLRLDNQGSIQAQTTSGQGGNITLQVPALLLLRRGSFISSTAGTNQAGGDGGNITFNGNFIVAVPRENSNISANAFTGRGGNIRITTQGLFGIEPRTTTTTGLSSITASSQFGISGTITLNTPNVDPSRGTAALPTGVIDTNALIASSCVARRSRQGRFVITGTGGLAPQPDDLANAAFPTYELVPQQPSQSSTSVTEADRIYRLSTGEVVLGRSCE